MSAQAEVDVRRRRPAAWPAGVARSQPDASGSVTVRLSTTAETPLAGTPAVPVTWTSIGGAARQLAGRNAALPVRVSNRRRGVTRREAVAGALREVAEDVDQAVRVAVRVEDLDRAVGADAHHDQVGNRAARAGVEVRRARVGRATRIDGEVVRSRWHRPPSRWRPPPSRPVGGSPAAPAIGTRIDSPGLSASSSTPPVPSRVSTSRTGAIGTKREAGVTTAGPGAGGAVRVLPRSAGEQPEVLEVAAQHLGRSAAQPSVDDRGVVRAEVDVMWHPLPAVEPGQRRLQPVQAAVHVLTDHEVRRRTTRDRCPDRRCPSSSARTRRTS